MKRSLLIYCAVFLGFTALASAQTVVTNGIILSNDHSNIKIVNPNTTGSFTLQLPTVPVLLPGEEQHLVLKMVGTDNGTELSFAPLANTLVSAPDQPMQRTEVSLAPFPSPLTSQVVHSFAEIDLPPVLPGEAFVVKLNQPLVKAGAAISISPSGEMPTGLFPAFAWCPVDCVVMIKFMNMGPTQVDLPAMQFGVGAINQR